MKKHFIIGLLMLMPLPVAAQIIQPGIIPGIMGCDYYASPAGSVSNDGKLLSRPFRIGDFWAVAVPGDTLCLGDGTYTGTSNRIVPPAGTNGTSASRITVRAIREGNVFIDGQVTNSPIVINGSNYIDIMGIDVGRCPANCILITGASATTNIRIYRTGGFDAATESVISIASGQNILLEDVYCFGIAHRCARVAFSGAQNITIRRIWGRIESGVDPEVRSTFNFARAIGGNVLWENVIASQPNNRGTGGSAGGVTFSNDVSGPNWSVYGSLVFARPGDAEVAALFNHTKGTKTGVTFQDVVAYTVGLSLTSGWGCEGTPCVNSQVNRYTQIGGNAFTIHSSWTGTNRVQYATLAAATAAGANPWTTTTHASLCNRYVDGVKTSTPLWPWPMDTRIRDAINRARTLQTAPLSPLLTGDSVTAEVESMLGTIPTGCRN